MTKSGKVAFFEEIMRNIDEEVITLSDEAMSYFEDLKESVEKKKTTTFTDNGKLILKFLQEQEEGSKWKSREIAEGLLISSRSVSGAMRKLVMDGYVDKISTEPAVYMLTSKGEEVKFDEE